METLRIDKRDSIAHIWLSRAQVRNAFDDVVVGELLQAFGNLDDDVRVVVLGGEGPVFCAGADVGWMKRSADFAEEQNQRDAEALAQTLCAIDTCPVPVIGRAHGAALGGGVGLLACCDIVVCTLGTRFAFTEVRLGVVPAVISCFVLPKAGAAATRRYFLTGETFEASVAKRMGFVHEVVAESELDSTIDGLCRLLKRGGPKALTEAKRLVGEVMARDRDDALQHAARTIARLRVSAEGQEGLSAFLEKRMPSWS